MLVVVVVLEYPLALCASLSSVATRQSGIYSSFYAFNISFLKSFASLCLIPGTLLLQNSTSMSNPFSLKMWSKDHSFVFVPD